MADNTPFLKLEVVWEDEHILELSITASNGRFSGKTEVYDSSDSLKEWAAQLVGFPRKEENVQYEINTSHEKAYFSSNFYPIEVSGLVCVQIQLEGDATFALRTEDKSAVTLDLLVEPYLIDVFLQQLIWLADKRWGSAMLIGRTWLIT